MFTLVTAGVTKSGRTVLCDVTADFDRGHITVVTGPSGAGKTTLLRLLNRLEDPTRGRVLIDGAPIDDIDVLALRRRVALVGQHPVLLTDSVGAEIRVGRSDLSPTETDRLLSAVGLAPDYSDRPTAGLSGGEAQRVCLARALALGPEVLVLDEPTSHLDAASARCIHTVIAEHRRAGGTVIVVSHDRDWITSAADAVLVLRGGLLVEHGAPRQVRYLGRIA